MKQLGKNMYECSRKEYNALPSIGKNWYIVNGLLVREGLIWGEVKKDYSIVLWEKRVRYRKTEKEKKEEKE